MFATDSFVANDGWILTYLNARTFAEQEIEYRLDVCYNNAEMYLAYFIKKEKRKKGKLTARFGTFHRSTLQKWTINRRDPSDRFINAKRREIIRNRAKMNYTLRK